MNDLIQQLYSNYNYYLHLLGTERWSQDSELGQLGFQNYVLSPVPWFPHKKEPPFRAGLETPVKQPCVHEC